MIQYSKCIKYTYGDENYDFVPGRIYLIDVEYGEAYQYDKKRYYFVPMHEWFDILNPVSPYDMLKHKMRRFISKYIYNIDKKR